MSRSFFPFVLFWSALIACQFLLVPVVQGGQWKMLETKYLILRYQSESDLKTAEKKIDFKASSDSFASFLDKKKPGEVPHQELIKSLDALFEKVQLILDMRKPIKKVSLRMFPDETTLHEMYFKIYKKKRALRAWYIFEYNTIYVNVQDLFPGMLAHEIAHAIVDNYMSVRPPRATAEILARYVDAHLTEKAKIY
jgi:hypothetical protein